ncbi:MAG: hypothetical protein HVN34_03465 [Methanobacteriaceae archaeon]|nr:hypothetical protein [Methanobacteriaceae archaeon]
MRGFIFKKIVVKLNGLAFIRKNYLILTVLGVYLLIGLVLLNHYQYLTNSDGISYISITQKYLIGDWENAINAYWGPLLSWLMVPFLFFSSSPLENLYLAKLLNLIIGFFIIIGVKLLSDKFGIKNEVQIAFLFSLIPAMLIFSFVNINPDLLVVCCLVFYLSFFFDEYYSYNLKNGIFCGLFGGLAFLSKSYAFVFFLFHFIVFNFYFYFGTVSNRKVILKNFLLGLSIFFIISGAWIGVISDKYGYLTIGTSGGYNYEIVGPESQGQAWSYQGLMKPPNNSAVSAWEDPSIYKMNSWSVFSSGDNFKHQLNLIWKNSVSILRIFVNYSILSLIILIGAILFVIKTDSKESRRKITCLLVTILIFSVFYIFIVVENRYLWLVYILTMITGIYLINHFYNVDKLKKFGRNILLAFLLTSFIVTPVMNLAITFNVGYDEYLLSQSLENVYNVKGNIASNDEWELSLYQAYYLNSKYYGTTINNEDVNSVNDQLTSNEIDYYLVWGDNGGYQLSDYEEITNGKISWLKVYSRNK